MIGQTISHYKITSKLGEGGMGVVYKAEDTSLGRSVALKFLAAHLTRDEEARKRFEREARAAAALHHPNVCTVHEIGEADGRTFLGMAFIEGQSLEAVIAQGPLPIPKALGIAEQIARALQAAHEKGIVHRDIKPANVMVDANGHVTVMDFGLALLTEGSRLTQLDSRLGTVAYMSPEQAQGAEVDHRTDIWALGCVLYEMICGERPFKGQYDQALIYEIVQEDPAPLTSLRTGVPLELEWIAGKCLAKEAGERYQSASELLVDLGAQQKKIQSGKSAVRKAAATVVTPLPTRAALTRNSKAVTAGVVAALILLVAAFVAGTHFAGESTVIPTYKRLTFRHGTVTSARFAPDGDSIVYSAAWEGGRRELYSTLPESSESRSLNIHDVDVLAISKNGEMALARHSPNSLGGSFQDVSRPLTATLLQVSLGGGGAREVLDNVLFADWTPQNELGVVRLMGGRSRIELPIGNVVYETSDRIASFRISPRDGRMAFAERPFGLGVDWKITTIGPKGEKTVAPVIGPDLLNLAWSFDPNTIWYETGWMGGKSVRALTPSGAERVVQRFPADVRLFDVSQDGLALVNRVNFRGGIYCLAPGQTAERELSWFDVAEVGDMSPDGTTILITEFGEGGGTDRWSVYLRKTTGEPAVRLGDGEGFALSPDGKMALTMTLGPPGELVLVPTGAGEPVRIRAHGIQSYEGMDWMPDGRHIVFAGTAPGEDVRGYIQDIEGGPPRPITPAGYRFEFLANLVSPDGKWVAAKAAGPPSLFSVTNGEQRPIAGVEPGEDFVAWSADGHSVFVRSESQVPLNIYKLDLSTGKRSLWRSLGPADSVGVIGIGSIQISADEKSYCYSYIRNISDLYLVEGLR